VRIKRADALDGILESVGAQVVPPDFHHGSSDSSLFGSQHSDGEAKTDDVLLRSPAATLRNDLNSKSNTDRSKWKTLRDFVDERGIEDALEAMESDRAALDVSALRSICSQLNLYCIRICWLRQTVTLNRCPIQYHQFAAPFPCQNPSYL
jgi:hypothetical protein